MYGRSDMPHTIELSNLTVNEGFRVDGIAAKTGGDVSDLAGFAVGASAADVNGDGYGDIVIGSWGADADTSVSFSDSGEAYVVFGGASGSVPAVIQLSDLDGSNGFRMPGLEEKTKAGFSVSIGPDLNNDGIRCVLCCVHPGGWNSGQ